MYSSVTITKYFGISRLIRANICIRWSIYKFQIPLITFLMKSCCFCYIVWVCVSYECAVLCFDISSYIDKHFTTNAWQIFL